MDGFIELIVGMWVVAIVSFAPLGYFIYVFSKDGRETFGKADPSAHNFEQSKYYEPINSIMSMLLGGTSQTVRASREPTHYEDVPEQTVNEASEDKKGTPEAPVPKGYGSVPVNK